MKDKKWLKDSITKEMQDLYGTIGPNYFDYEYTNKRIKGLVDQLGKPEVKRLERKIKELDSYNDELIRDNNQLRNELDNPEVLSQEWIDEHTWNNNLVGRPFVYVDDLQSLPVPKQEITEKQAWEKISKYYPVEQGSLKNAVEHFYYDGLMTGAFDKKPLIPQWVADNIEIGRAHV